MRAHTAKSAAIAGTARTLSRCPRQAVASVASATTNKAVVSGTSSWVVMINARAVITVAKVATQGIICRLRCHASVNVSTAKAHSTTELKAGDSTWKRTVDSHSKGERMSAEVTPYVTLAKRLAT